MENWSLFECLKTGMSWFELEADGIPLLIIFWSMIVKNLLNFQLQQSKNFLQFLQNLKFQACHCLW